MKTHKDYTEYCQALADEIKQRCKADGVDVNDPEGGDIIADIVEGTQYEQSCFKARELVRAVEDGGTGSETTYAVVTDIFNSNGPGGCKYERYLNPMDEDIWGAMHCAWASEAIRYGVGVLLKSEEDIIADGEGFLPKGANVTKWENSL